VAQLIVRNLEDEVVHRLKQRAAQHGCSAEEEHRRILRRTLLSGGFLDAITSIPSVGDDADFERAASTQRAVDL